MIKVSEYLDQTISILNNQDLDTFNKQFMFQKEYLNSQDYNYDFNNIEFALRTLYERTRLIEDLIAYAEEYIKTQIYTINDQCKIILKNIENIIDQTKVNNYTENLIEFVPSVDNYLDRNNELIQEAYVCDGTLTLSNKKEDSIEIKNITLKNNLISYKNTLDKLLKGDIYRTFYMLDAPINSGLYETLHVELKNESDVNQILTKTANCEIKQLVFYYADGKAEIVVPSFIVNKTRKVIAIDITICSSNYNKQIYYVDKSRLINTCWDKIAESIYNSYTGNKNVLTQEEVDSLLGMTTFKTAYREYLDKMETWIEIRKQIAVLNKSNGYEDTVPKIDFVVAPEQISSYINAAAEIKDVDTSLRNMKISTTSKIILSSESKLISETIDKQKYLPSIEAMASQIVYYDLLNKTYQDKNGKEKEIF